MADYMAFSSGIILIGDVGASLSSPSNAIINIQNVTFPFSYQQAVARAASWVNNYATADAQYDAAAMLTFSTDSFSTLILPYILGVDGNSAGGKTTFTPTVTSKPRYIQTVFNGQEQSTGKNILITIPRGKILAWNPQFGRTAFSNAQFQVETLPNAVGTTYAPFTVVVDN